MRIRFEFEFTELPIAYRLCTLSIIKEMIRKGSKTYYEENFESRLNNLKPFAHAIYINELSIKDDIITGNRLFLTVSSPSYEFIMHLMNGSQRRDKYIYKDYSLTLIRKSLLPKPMPFSEEVLFKTMSPILIENKEKTPLLSKHAEFEREFNYYAELIVSELYMRNLYSPIQIIDSSMKKVVIKENVHQDLEKPLYFTGNQGLIQLKGHPEDLQVIYDSGIGQRRSLGFGLLEVEEVIT